MFYYAEKNLVKMYGGSEAELGEGWYFLEGQTLNTKIFGVVTLPDLQGNFLRFGDADFTGDVVSSGTDVSNWGMTDGAHSHTFYYTIASCNTTGSHTHGSVSLTATNVSLLYAGTTTQSRPNEMRSGTQHNEEGNMVWSSDKYESSAKLGSSGTAHNHSVTRSWSNFGGQTHSHNHSVASNMWDSSDTRPEGFGVRLIVFLGPLAE